MCNINALYARNGKKNNTVPFLMAVTSNSFASNRDGEGIFTNFNNKVVKSKDKIDYFSMKDIIEKSNVVITHQRLSTSGFELKYNHPFEDKEFIIVHNGIINHFKEGEGSDTYGFFKKFIITFKKMKGDRENRILKTIKTLFDEDLGSYSILIYDKVTKLSYYFKDSTTRISFYRNKDFLYITTEDSNSLFLNLLNCGKFNELIVEDRAIYRITQNGKVFRLHKWKETKKWYEEESDTTTVTPSTETETNETEKTIKDKNGNMIFEGEEEGQEEGYAEFGNDLNAEIDLKEKVNRKWSGWAY
jgi:predicted glutamine amidotransferase